MPCKVFSFFKFCSPILFNKNVTKLRVAKFTGTYLGRRRSVRVLEKPCPPHFERIKTPYPYPMRANSKYVKISIYIYIYINKSIYIYICVRVCQKCRCLTDIMHICICVCVCSCIVLYYNIFCYMEIHAENSRALPSTCQGRAAPGATVGVEPCLSCLSSMTYFSITFRRTFLVYRLCRGISNVTRCVCIRCSTANSTNTNG